VSTEVRAVSRALTVLAALLSIASGAYMVAYQEASESVPAAFDVLLNGIGGYFVAWGLYLIATVFRGRAPDE
jgi:hypothetical protein